VRYSAATNVCSGDLDFLHIFRKDWSQHMQRFLWICLAGALGTGARHLVNVWTTEKFGTAFPYGTLAVNVVGCFAIALVMRVALYTPAFSPELRLALTTGFLGGLTTYSSFNYELASLYRDGTRTMALVYGVGTVTSCIVAGLLGLALAERLLSA
jgi:CrcB protein